MQQQKNVIYPSNGFGQLWMKVPLVIRSVLLGFGVSTLGIGIWIFLVTNIPIPWSVMAMGAILIFYWMYFSGRWNPANTQTYRRFCFRQLRLEKPIWIWGLAGAFSVILLLHSGFILTFRLNEFQPEIFKTARFLNDLPSWQGWSIIIMGSLVAGICEEIGFRAYMQKPLENKYGPITGISITSVVFVIVHLHQAWANGILVGIFAISFVLGYLAYASNSLIPGIIAHVSFDIINFSYWWSDVIGTFDRRPIGVTGIDIHFIITLTVVLLCIALFIISFRKLLKLKMANVPSPK
ncbi:MAG: CPBP family intramembrane metalloprotease [Bacteroidia bacterium]|nr:CPBP family intramembrane metalloprotease [Bacteroidia bacterium]